MEQIWLADQQRFGRHTEKLAEIAGQLSLFNEAEACLDDQVQEPSIDDVAGNALRSARRPKKKGQPEEDLRDFPQEEIPHDVPAERLDDLFGEGNYKSMPDEICWQLRFEPARWIAEKHIIKVYVGTDGVHQDEFLRGDHPYTLYRGQHSDPFPVGRDHQLQICEQQPAGPYRQRIPDQWITFIQTDHVQLGSVVGGKILPAGMRSDEKDPAAGTCKPRK